METAERSNSIVEFHRYKRKRFPVPVLPPRVPVTHIPVAKFFSYKSSKHNGKLDDACIDSQVQKLNSVPFIPADEPPHQEDSDVVQGKSDYINADDAFENGRAFHFVDTESKENYRTLPDALANAFEQNVRTPPVSLPTADSANVIPLNEYRHCCEDASPMDDIDRIKSSSAKCDYDRNPPVPLRRSKKVFSIETQCTRTMASALVARKIDLGTLNCDSFARNSDERIFNTLDYRLRYGISRLEINSKHSSNRDKTLLPNKGSYSECSPDGPLAYQTSTAATFFARASQKLKLNSSPHRRKRRGSASEDGASAATAAIKSVGGFSNLLHRNPPPLPSALLRKIGQKEATGIGKVRVLVKVCADAASLVPEDKQTPVFTIDKKKRQIALYEPQPTPNSATNEGEERKTCMSAPKMFAFEALFSEDDPQLELCSNALTDVIHAVINGNDGCIFCFGHSKTGKTKAMIGTSESPSTLGVIPCAIAWLYRVVNEQKQKTGARFSVRVSAIEITAASQQIKDLLTDYASDNEQSPGVYLEDDPILGSHLQNRSELRAPLPEKAAFYLDTAQSERSTHEDSHFLYTLHVYQYDVANKGAIAGGRSRLYLIDLAANDPSKGGNSLSISNLGNVLLAILNGQKHLPHRDHKIIQVLKECLSSLTCHASIIAHVSPLPQHYHETLATVQFASRIHRIRRRKIKFTGVSNGVNTTIDENGRLTSSSDFDPSSSEQSADTVIYVGPSDETDGEHPPVCIPSLNSADNRGVLSRVLRESDSDYLRISKLPIASRSVPASPLKTPKTVDKVNIAPYSPAKRHHLKSSGFHSAHSSPVRTIGRAPDTASGKLLEELWIDGPRISKSKIAEARNVHMMRKEGQKMFSKRETWVDGPMKKSHQELAYGFMDNHKKSMIRKWVENQSMQLHSRIRGIEERKNSYKALTVFKTCENGADTETEDGRGQGSGQEDDNEAKAINRGWQLQAEQMDLNKKYNVQRIDARLDENITDNSDEEIEIEIIEVEEPEEPVPTQDSCLQVTEEDIAFCMGELENPLPEVDQEEHPLRVLSQENMTVVSTFTDSMSVVNDLDRLFPRSRWCLHNTRSQVPMNGNLNSTRFTNEFTNDKDKTRSQLFKLHEIYENKFDLNSCLTTKHLNGDTVRAVSRCQSMMLSELCNPGENNLRSNDFENSSIASEPAYMANNRNDRLCENCKVSLTSVPHASEKNNFWSSHEEDLMLNKFQSFRHLKNIMNLRHPDGASNPNLQEMEGNGKLSNGNKDDESVSDDEDDESQVPLPPTSKLLTLSREKFNGRLFTKCCDNADFVDVTGNENFCNDSSKRSDHLFGQKSPCLRANVKKLQTYRVELKNKK